MSEEYLFEKQGSDGEIERLEDLLSTYRIMPAAPLMAQTSSRRVFRFGWFKFRYVAAFATLVILLGAAFAAVRLFIRTDHEVVAITPAETPVVDRPFVAPSTNDQATVSQPKLDVSPPKNGRKVKSYISVAARSHRRPTDNKVVAVKAPQLTKEEQYAYDQLKVALWIAGSKIKVVQDTINRVDERKPDTSSDKR